MARLRIFAGPNGSGKSTLFHKLQGQFNFGYYLNADDLHKELSLTHVLDLDEIGITSSQASWRAFWQKHGLKERAPGLTGSRVDQNLLVFQQEPKSYETAILADFLRKELLKSGESFTFETVFSHPGKLDIIKRAVDCGYKVYLYFASVSSPEISIDRVRQRVLQGGHNVPEDKIRSRYDRALDNLLPAIRMVHRAYFFDNSKQMDLIAEVDPEEDLIIHADKVPAWFNDFVLERL